jgi:hypothetical protein
VIYLKLTPRLASESNDSASVTLHKIMALIRTAKFSIHDLSRIQAKRKGEFYRLNMPFELGLDYGCREYGDGRFAAKRLLILEQVARQYQAGLSDLAGCDIQVHGGQFDVVVRKVRNWLVSEARIKAPGASRIIDAYAVFQKWYYEGQLAVGFDEKDIQDYPTAELLAAMMEWMTLGMPV